MLKFYIKNVNYSTFKNYILLFYYLYLSLYIILMVSLTINTCVKSFIN
jgi:hypothetical protein